MHIHLYQYSFFTLLRSALNMQCGATNFLLQISFMYKIDKQKLKNKNNKATKQTTNIKFIAVNSINIE